MAREPSEPRVDDLLATIRRAIDRDISELDAREQAATRPRSTPPPLQAAYGSPPPPPRLRGTLVESSRPDPGGFRRNADDAIANLRQRVEQHRQQSATGSSLALPTPQVAQRPGPMESILSAEDGDYANANGYGHTSYAAQAGSYLDQVQAGYEEPHEAEGLLSDESAYATQASFQALSASFIEQMGGPAQIEAMTREMLRPMLKQWLDENLPGLVEELVRAEIARVARRR